MHWVQTVAEVQKPQFKSSLEQLWQTPAKSKVYPEKHAVQIEQDEQVEQ
jgi:hypothetical protein